MPQKALPLSEALTRWIIRHWKCSLLIAGYPSQQLAKLESMALRPMREEGEQPQAQLVGLQRNENIGVRDETREIYSFTFLSI